MRRDDLDQKLASCHDKGRKLWWAIPMPQESWSCSPRLELPQPICNTEDEPCTKPKRHSAMSPSSLCLLLSESSSESPMHDQLDDDLRSLRDSPAQPSCPGTPAAPGTPRRHTTRPSSSPPTRLAIRSADPKPLGHGIGSRKGRRGRCGRRHRRKRTPRSSTAQGQHAVEQLSSCRSDASSQGANREW